MNKNKKIIFFLISCICMIVSSCSSENAPVAEVFLGDWEIYQKNENNTGLVAATGEMNIDFGNDVITFQLEVDGTDNIEPVSMTGIVYNSALYSDTSRQIKLGSLELTKSNTLIITIEKEESEQVIYYGR